MRGLIALASFAAVVSLTAAATQAPTPPAATAPPRPDVPRVWDDTALADWATPLAGSGLNARPSHITSSAYYALPVDNLKTYPVYAPGREPAGYWAQLQAAGPKPLLDVAALKTEADWLTAGRTVFDEADHPLQRTLDPSLVGRVRDAAWVAASGTDVLPDGTLQDVRWVPTRDGVALTMPACASCHTAFAADAARVRGVPFLGMRRIRPTFIVGDLLYANAVVHAFSPFSMPTQDVGTRNYQAWGVPWRHDDINARFKTMSRAEFDVHRLNYGRSGGQLRWNGSPFFPAKVPDLIGIADRRYFDATGSHLHRDIGDLMRYAALILSAESATFGSHQVLLPTTRRATHRWSDEALFALARYLYSLTPPANPNPIDAAARAGEAIFDREDCQKCHTPPLYTSNKLTLAAGFRPPDRAPSSLDIMRKSVGTDSGLALQTRKGTGYYKVPSLKGLWYRGRYLHDGSVSTLEEMFDPGRLDPSHVPGGWSPPGVKARAIPGHDFGLELEPAERTQLIAFLRTL